MSKTTRDMWELRNGFYQWVADYVKEQSYNVCELREPTKEHNKHNKGKIIGFVESMSQSKKIESELLNKLENTNTQLQALGSSAGLSVTPINIQIKAIAPVGDVILTSKPAERRLSVEGKEAQADIKAYIEYLKCNECPNYNKIHIAEDLYRNIKTDELYTMGTDSGTSYRVAYYNSLDGCRVQQSVCDVLLIAGEGISLVDVPKRKCRKDKAEQLGVYYKRLLSSDEWILHRLYKFDKRYFQRRIKRLDNK